MNLARNITGFCIFCLLISCEPEDDNGIPGYIYVDNFNVVTDYEKQGSARHRITDIWVNVKGRETLGGWELPAVIPVLETGSTEMHLQAGVHQNGIAGTRARYDFLEAYIRDVDLVPGKVDTLNPEVSYKDNVNFLLLEDFSDENTPAFVISQTSDVNEYEITTDPDEVYEGESSFKGHIENANEVLEIVSNESFRYTGGSDVYLEVDFRSDVVIRVGIFAIVNGTHTQYSHLELNPNDEWRKVYIHLTNIISETAGRQGRFRVFFGAFNNEEGPKTFYLDNIKLLH